MFVYMDIYMQFCRVNTHIKKRNERGLYIKL